MIDTYFASEDAQLLAQFASFFTNVLGPMPGDDGKFYLCIRAPIAVAPVAGLEVVTAEEGQAVLGLWAGQEAS